MNKKLYHENKYIVLNCIRRYKFLKKHIVAKLYYKMQNHTNINNSEFISTKIYGTKSKINICIVLIQGKEEVELNKV